MLSFRECQEIINAAIKDIQLPAEPSNLYDPIRYILDIGGKRLRPCLVLMACNVYDDKIEKAVFPALAYEVFHNFTLMHDDIMDNSSLRRNQPTVHVKWSVNTGILSGDAMVIKAYELLSGSSGSIVPGLLKIFNSTALKLCEGQQFDLDFEQKAEISPDVYLKMIKLKTSALLAGALETGACIGGARPDDLAKFCNFGIDLGVAFQIQDDWLDLYAGDESFGKVRGNDIINNKKTMLLVQALQLSGNKYKRELLSWLGKGVYDPEKKLEAVSGIFNELGIRDLTLDIIEEYYNRAIRSLEEINAPLERKAEIYDIARKLLKRKS